MVSGAPPAMAAGGLLLMEYADPVVGERHNLMTHLAHFEPLTFSYTGTGPKAPSETNVEATFAALATLWAAYYPASWTLRPVALYFSDGGSFEEVAALPPWTPVIGTAGTASALGPAVQRILHARTLAGGKRRMHLHRMTGRLVDTIAEISALGGGLDARDVALLAYLSSAATGAVGPDGFGFKSDGSVEVQVDKPLVLAPPGLGTGPYVVSG